jgi:glycosyltransferase involved in cell wall biosynthesis
MSTPGVPLLFFTALSWAMALAWLWKGIASLIGMRKVTDLARLPLESLPALADGTAPHLSVLIPACNEEASIENTLLALAASREIRLEIIAINDRSTDSTGERIEALIARITSPHTIRVLHIHELPPGWLGKPHALSVGVAAAKAPWLLFTDGDVHFEPEALSRSLRWAYQQQADHLAIPPAQQLRSFGEVIMFGTMNAFVPWSIRPWKIADPNSRDSIGVGGFNMIRAETLEKLGGMQTLRMEVVEDLFLGKLVKKAGFAQRFALAPEWISIHWLTGWLSILKLTEKNGFAVCRYRISIALAVTFGLLLNAVVPVIAAAMGGWLLASAALMYLGIVLVYQANRRMSGVSPLAAIGFAPSAALCAYAFLRSMIVTLKHDGVQWRGTFYPLKSLRRFIAGE